jgi:hypothetical protein
MGQVMMLPGAPQGVLTYLKRLYYDTALSANPHVLRSLQELVDASHILFGSDHPFAPEILTGFTVQGIENYDGFDEQACRAVERESALALFPRFGSVWRKAHRRPDLSLEERPEADKVAVGMTQRGTHQGTLFGGPPTGKHIIAAGIAVFRLKERQIVEEWLITDQLGMM